MLSDRPDFSKAVSHQRDIPDIGAGFGEAACHGFSEAFAAAGDEGHLSGKIEQ